VEALQPERDRSRNPLAQVLLQLFEPSDASPRHLAGLHGEPLPASGRSSRFDLEIFLQRSPDDSLRGTLSFATDLFHADRIERLSAQLLTLLATATATPDAPAATLHLLPEAERALIETWQQGPRMEVPDLCVHQLFERQVDLSPDAIALVFEDQQLSYAELNARANQLAHHLIAKGVGPEVIVAVCLERSIELIVALLAILKAGGAYLPLDPAWPQDRQHLLLDEAGCTLLVEKKGPVVIHRPQSAPATVPGVPLAYITYTSGSTSNPKGVAVGHRAILRLVHPVNGYQLSAGHRVLQLAPVAFDASTLEIWGPLLCGGTLVIPPAGQLSPAELAALLREHQITTLWLTAGLFHTMVDHELEALTGVSQLLAGGDVLSPEHVTRLLNAFPAGHELINGYGPSENTTFTCCHRLAAGITLTESSVPIGRPIAATFVRVLDRNGRPSPIGIPGELHIGGAGLARGYLNNPELTAEKFIPDPYSSDPTARLYKSGDLASWNPDGTLAFHGRIDQQIKLRGYRIEPGEIEANLLAHPAVAQAAVLLRHDDPANPRLIAYWVPQQLPAQPALAASSSSAALTNNAASGDGNGNGNGNGNGSSDGDGNGSGDGTASALAPLTSKQLRSFLADRLPDYMVPSAFVALEALPLTANGKLDCKALPAPSFAGDLAQRIPPCTELERQLHRLWAEVLGHSDFGITDNFFMVGGHSLSAAQLVAAISSRLHHTMPVAAIFQAPTLREQVAWLTAQPHSASTSSLRAPLQRPDHSTANLVTLQPLGSLPPVFVVHGWGGTLGAFIDLARSLAPHRPVLGLQASAAGLADPELPSVRAMAADYADQILRRQPEGPIHLLGYSAGGWYAHAVAIELQKRGANLGLFAVLDTGVVAQVHRRLGLTLLWRHGLPRLKPEGSLRHHLLRPSAWKTLLRRQAGQLNSQLYWYLNWKYNRPGQRSQADPFVALLKRNYRPERSSLAVEIFAPPQQLPELQRLWSFYASGGVRCHPLFSEHLDFYRPELAPSLAEAILAALERAEWEWLQQQDTLKPHSAYRNGGATPAVQTPMGAEQQPTSQGSTGRG